MKTKYRACMILLHASVTSLFTDSFHNFRLPVYEIYTFCKGGELIYASKSAPACLYSSCFTKCWDSVET